MPLSSALSRLPFFSSPKAMGFLVGNAAPAVGLVAELLEHAASDDVRHFVLSASRDCTAVHVTGFWYGRCPVSARMGFLHRTPLMVAAAYGSLDVLEVILSVTAPGDVDFQCGADSFTALHCAAFGGATNAPLAIILLLDAGADLNAVDAAGRRPVDLISNTPILSRRSSLEYALGNISPPPSPSSSSSSSSSPRKEKKNYPIDLSIPDIKSSMYSSDEFRMFTFKIKPCSRAYSHDWTECPFLHPGENARRRDPRRIQYNCTPCADFRRGQCPKGDLCEYAHGVFECWLHPAQYRTRLCKDGNSCTRRVCFFAHSTNDLRSLPMQIPHLLVRTPRNSDAEVNSPFCASTPADCPSPKFKSDNYTMSLSPTSLNYHHPKQQQWRTILSPRAVNSLHCMPPPLRMSPRISDEIIVRSPSSSCHHSIPSEREKLDLQLEEQQMRSTFGWNSQVEQVDEEPDLSWVQNLVGNSEVGGAGCLFGEEAPCATIDEERAVLKAWLERMRLDNNPAL